MRRMHAAGIKPDAMSYNSMLQAVTKGGDMLRAEHLLESMRKELIEPNAICYNSLISGCARKGDVDRAEYWLETMIKEEVSDQTHTRHTTHLFFLFAIFQDGLTADVVNYSAVIHASCAIG